MPRTKPKAVVQGRDIRTLFRETPQDRPPLRELSAQEFNERSRSAIGGFRLPTYETKFLKQFSSCLSNSATDKVVRNADDHTLAPGLGLGATSNGTFKAPPAVNGTETPPRATKRRRLCHPHQHSSKLPDLMVVDSEDKLGMANQVHIQHRRLHCTSSDESSEEEAQSEGSVFNDASSPSDSSVTSDEAESFDNGSAIQSDDLSDDDLCKPKPVNQHLSSQTEKATSVDKQSHVTLGSIRNKRATSKKMKSLLQYKHKGLDSTAAPLSEINDIFVDLTKRADHLGLGESLKHLDSQPLRVATMCSGTESPLLALQMIQDAVKKLGLRELNVKHLFSAEIVPYKQAYIERNFHPPIIFRDITELTRVVEDNEPTATTAYGGKVIVPVEVDILIAGTSCVDFSGLNRHRKGLDGGGESDDTWHAVLNYCRAFHPAIVILENVKNAAWDAMLDDYASIGYDSAGVLVDSKEFYIPHTRQRGYMACFDKAKLSKVGSAGAGEQWKSLMESLKRPASTPVSSFLLPGNKISHRQTHNDDVRVDVDWSTCEITQMEYRQTRRLGNARPVTHWSESGSMLVPEHAHAPWFNRQVERVLDTIDGATLRKALPVYGMYDASFKTRIWDLSQNIYRFQDTQPFGVSTCVTPSGLLYLSDAARALAPEETLTLQGIPLNMISFTTESPSDMQDLAGNAMTSTVIGTAIVCVLIAGHKAIRTQTCNNLIPSPAKKQDQKRHTILLPGATETVVPSNPIATFDLSGLLHQAQRAGRKCFCEGFNGMTKRPLQECRDCGHTSCVSCSGNPVHNYHQAPGLNEGRISPFRFQNELRSLLPLRLKLEGVETLDLRRAYRVDKDYSRTVSHASSQAFALEDIRRTHSWTIRYSAPGAHLDLIINNLGAEWRLYVHPDKQLPSNHAQRAMLRQPVGKCSAVDSLLPGNGWRWRTPIRTTYRVKITGSESQIASWWSRNGMPDFTAHSVPEFLEIDVHEDAGAALRDELNGRYQYFPNCGKACSSLYKRLDPGDVPLYFFLDPSRTGAPEQDCFVFSYNIDLLEYDEVRPIVAHVAAPWRAWPKDGNSRGAFVDNASLVVEESWHDWQTAIGLRACDLHVEVQAARNLGDAERVLDCSQALVLMGSRVPVNLVRGLDDNAGITIDPRTGGFFKLNAWLFEAMRREMPLQDWTSISRHFEDSSCTDCAPARPALRWKLEGANIVPYDDQRTAALYEGAIKSRPDPIVINAARDGSVVCLTIGLNIGTLAHRAYAKLPHGLTNVNSQWKFDTSATQAGSFSFLPFKLSATRDIEPFAKKIDLSVDLFPKQRLALAWMQRQEAGVNFLLEEAEEAAISSLAWRAEVRVQGTINVRGGICADHPGFGKTVTSLALIQSHFEEQTRSDIEADLSTRQPVLGGLIPTAATLIICPGSLVRQWASEIQEKLSWKNGLITVRTVAELRKLRINAFTNAKIIIVARSVLGSDSYIEKLAAFTAMPGPATKSGRAFGQWLAHASKQVPEHLRILQVEGVENFKRHIKATYKANVDSNDFKAAIPSRRLRGKDYVEGKQKQSASNLKAASGTVDTNDVQMPLFEMFYFNRLIVDEFHQCDNKEYAAVTALNADKRWGLSATPAMGDFYDLAQMAGLLGVKLRLGSDARGIMKIKNSRELRKDMSSFELFDMMRQMPSDMMHRRIHEIDQLFLDTFVRQNIMDFSEMKYDDHLVPVNLDLAHRATYMELSQYLNSLDMRIKKGNTTKIADDRQKRLNEAVESSLTAEEALSKSAAFADDTKLRDLVTVRQQQISEIIAELPKLIAKAQTAESETYSNWRDGMSTRNFGDEDAVKLILALLKPADASSRAKKKITKESESDDDAKQGRGSGKRSCTAALNKMCNRLLLAKRSLRYLQNIEHLHNATAVNGGSSISSCDNIECTGVEGVGTDIAISAFCGHKLCRTCYMLLKSKAILHCPADGCSSTMQDFHFLWTNKLSDLKTRTAFSYGAKIDAAVGLIQSISKKGDQAILFVQYDNQLAHVAAALDERGILAQVVTKPADAAAQIQNFCGSAKTKQPVPVIILNASDETAAGLNLQNANHVLFLSPLLRDTQYGYDATMAQAIGRVRRHGQKKKIHVYRIFALDTIDVDILEHRERRVDAMVERDADEITAPELAMEVDDPDKERTQLVREDGHFSLRPQSWLVRRREEESAAADLDKVRGRSRVLGWEDFSSLVKFSRAFTEDDD